MIKKLYLYGTSDCHLCEQAEALVKQQIAGTVYQLEKIDIVDDDALFQAYAVRIPVLLDPEQNSELAWPFDRSAVTRFLA